MLGRLARYLRMVGQDTAYAHGISDAEIIEQARREGRTVLTRDRGLAARAPGTVLLVCTGIADQVRAVHAVAPGAGWTPSFERCTECNGRLAPVPRGERPAGAPDRRGSPPPLFRCPECAHLYWEGTHTEDVRRRVRGWLSGVPV